jgi:hypothetical protein
MKPARIISSCLGITAMLGLLCCDPGSVDKPGVDGGLATIADAARSDLSGTDTLGVDLTAGSDLAAGSDHPAGSDSGDSCQPGSRRCAGLTPEVCSSDGSSW